MLLLFNFDTNLFKNKIMVLPDAAFGYSMDLCSCNIDYCQNWSILEHDFFKKNPKLDCCWKMVFIKTGLFPEHCIYQKWSMLKHGICQNWSLFKDIICQNLFMLLHFDFYQKPLI